MRDFEEIEFDKGICREQLNEFDNLLAQNVSIAGKLVPILTYDQLANDFRQRLQMYGASG